MKYKRKGNEKTERETALETLEWYYANVINEKR